MNDAQNESLTADRITLSATALIALEPAVSLRARRLLPDVRDVRRLKFN
jgi:hypothetical protein